MSLTPRLDLRGGRDCWQDDPETFPTSDILPTETVDVAVVGAGVTGAMLAQRLATDGHSVLVLDRRRPATGSTAASTALVLWASDVPFVEHRDRYGSDGAAARWRAVFEAVQTLDRRVRALGLDCSWASRPDVYLTGDRLDRDALRREAEARKAARLPSEWIDAEEISRRFGVKAEAALVSDGAYAANPVALTRGLLRAAQANGARLVFPAEVMAMTEAQDGVALRLDGDRSLSARRVILATGYETDLAPGFTLGSSFAVASPPGQAAAWREQAMIWEASDPYLYLRTTEDGRIVVGGEDESFADADRRDALIAAKAERLVEKAQARLPGLRFEPDCAWAATFGSSRDGLAAIGRRRGSSRTFLAQSFGGNGIAFAALAADILAAEVAGAPDPRTHLFGPYRFASTRNE